jgi:hypothetical protein
MKYWAFLAAKMAGAGTLLYYLWALVAWIVPPPRSTYRGRFLGYDLTWTFLAGAFFLVCSGAAYLIWRDQRYRCRVCLHRLRMPVVTGSWGQMLQLGRPHIEYICPYGHGTLKVPELQIAGLEAPDWRANEDMWTELETKR